MGTQALGYERLVRRVIIIENRNRFSMIAIGVMCRAVCLAFASERQFWLQKSTKAGAGHRERVAPTSGEPLLRNNQQGSGDRNPGDYLPG